MAHRCPFWVQYLLISPLRRLMEPADVLLGPHVRPGMTVVEPGCGFGYFTLPLAEMVGPGGRVVAVDVEPRAIERLGKRAARAGLDRRVDARTCDPRDMGLGDHAGRVDLVTVIHALHELEDLLGFLQQVKTLLVPRGKMLVIEPSGHVKPAQFDAMMATCRQAGFRPLERPSAGKKLTALLTPSD